MTQVLITGANGQLGKSIHKIASEHPELELVFKGSRELDITNAEDVKQAFDSGRYRYCINCAAYTNVEKAESEPEKAYSVNAEGVRNLAANCLKNDVTLIHISTDYVFDGEKEEPYSIQDKPNPINIYGASKLMGENHVRELLDSYLIIRTSWLYSEFGKNFYKTIIQKAKVGGNLKSYRRTDWMPYPCRQLSKFHPKPYRVRYHRLWPLPFHRRRGHDMVWVCQEDIDE